MTNINLPNNTIPICFAANDYYVPYMSVMMQSIMENASLEREYKFFVLHKDINSSNMDLLKKQAVLFPQFTLDFIDVSSLINKYNLFVSRHVTIEAYFRLLIPYILKDYNKALYFDGDMISLCDVKDLFDTGLRENLFAAVRDVGVLWYYNPAHSKEDRQIYDVLLHLKSPQDYFNDGMLVWNIEKFRNTISQDELFKFAMSREWQVHDQDILNVLSEGKTLHLSFKWDFMRQDEWAKHLPDNLKKDYFESEKAPKILHFKPYGSVFNIPYSWCFWKYATRTPFINEITGRMAKQGLVSSKNLYDEFIDRIKTRNSKGITTILRDCLKARFFRSNQ